MSLTQIKTKIPTKEQLEQDYYVLNLSQQQIAEKYNYKTRQVISRLFTKYNIQTKSKSEQANTVFSKKVNVPTKEELLQLYENNSISSLAKLLKVSRTVASNWLNNYQIETTYFKYSADIDELKIDINLLSLKEIEIKYQFPIVELKRRILNKLDLPIIILSIDRLKEIILLYDVNNNGFAKQIKLDDINVYNSILQHTNNHILQSDKITERVYRILNDYGSDYIPKCDATNETLKFYTIYKGYGNSDLKLSKRGFTTSYDFSRYSQVSQKLFWEIYNLLTEEDKKEVKFGELNSELIIPINGESKEKMNKHIYSMDFVFNTRNIEFDGDYWHSIEGADIKDNLRDQYIQSLGYSILRIPERDYRKNKEETLNRCIQFLTE
jgi:very-short-patch-repair endonuclease